MHPYFPAQLPAISCRRHTTYACGWSPAPNLQLALEQAGTVKRVSMELGGNAPFIVFGMPPLDHRIAPFPCQFPCSLGGFNTSTAGYVKSQRMRYNEARGTTILTRCAQMMGAGDADVDAAVEGVMASTAPAPLVVDDLVIASTAAAFHVMASTALAPHLDLASTAAAFHDVMTCFVRKGFFFFFLFSFFAYYVANCPRGTRHILV